MARILIEAGDVVWFGAGGARVVGKVKLVRGDIVVVEDASGKLRKGPMNKFTVQQTNGAKVTMGPVWSLQNLRRSRLLAPDAASLLVRLNGLPVLKIVSRGGSDITLTALDNAPDGVALTFHRYVKLWAGTGDFGTALEAWIDWRTNGINLSAEEFLKGRAATLEMMVSNVVDFQRATMEPEALEA